MAIAVNFWHIDNYQNYIVVFTFFGTPIRAMSTDTFEALFGWIMKIAIAQINPIIGDFEYNFD
ncbi:MAG: hypothetical protein QF888_03085, partial [Desulfobacterales bacterium]|nr:hypothetical protein [Desulfobacterales bacterium]